MWKIVIGAAAAAAAILLGAKFGYQSIAAGRKLRKLKWERQGYGIEDFVEELHEAGVEDGLAMRIFEYMQDCVAGRGFPVMPSDSLVEVYEIDRWGGVELSEMLEDLSPEIDWNKRFKGEVADLITVRDLALKIAEAEAEELQ